MTAAPRRAPGGQPLFSIGITTYDRPALLADCLRSVLRQTVGDFEVLVGNDHQATPLTAEMLGIDDPRLRILNHPVNLGERENLNALLAASRGRYFTWQADDDFYDPRYLEAVAAALAADPALEAVFTGFRIFRGAGVATVPPAAELPAPRVLPGEEFLAGYWAGTIRTMGLVGMYAAEYLRREGGVRDFAGARIAVMSEYFLLLRASLLPRVGFVDAPLVWYRVHADSWSAGGGSPEAVERAGLNFLREGVAALAGVSGARDVSRDLRGLVRLVFHDVVKTLARRSTPSALLSHARGFAARARAALREGGAHAVVPDRRVTAEVTMALLRLLPQALFFTVAPAWLRGAATRARGRFRHEVYLPQAQ